MNRTHPIQLVKYLAITCLALVFASVSAMAQETWEQEGEGEIKNVEIEIVKDRKIVLPQASRNFEKVPPRPYEPIKPAITYELKTFSFSSPEFKPLIRPLKLKQEELSRINGNYLSAGFGNYSSFFVEGDISTKRDKNKFIGAHVYSKYFGSGPVNGSASGSSVINGRVFGKLTGKAITADGEISFDNRGGYFYGGQMLETDKDRIRQTYNTFALQAGITNTRLGDFNYGLRAGFSHLTDHYTAGENITSLTFRSDYALDKASKILVNADYYLISRKDSLVSLGSRHLLRVKPYYQFSPMEKLMLTVGLNVALQNDQYAGSKDFHIYPHARADYELSQSVKAYALITGDMDKVDLHSLSAENFWVDRNISVLHTNRAFEFSAGLKGKLGRHWSGGLGVSAATLKNYYYYYLGLDASGPVTLLTNKFMTTYDGTSQRMNPFAELSYAQADKFKMNFRADYFKYDTELPEAWNRPTFKLNVSASYNFYEKIYVEVGLLSQGGMKGYDPSLGTITLDPATDIFFKGRYFVSRQFSAFVQCNNILSKNYPLYQSYPSRGFQAMGGVSWSF